MPSTFTWLDHSDSDRRRVLDAIDRFKESDTRDELGLATIRDGFADLFFPGVSVIQTRARYFLFVPWIYGALEAKKVSADRFARRARQDETKLIEALLAGGEQEGVLGRRVGAALKRLPSNIYWLGLGAWKIRSFLGSQDEYHRSTDAFYDRRDRVSRDEDGELLSGGGRNWHGDLPRAPEGLLDAANFALSVDEARYLRERILLGCRGSLLEFFVRRAQDVDADFPWEHPSTADLPASLRSAVTHAGVFAEVMQGAALLYNLLLAESLPDGDRRTELIENYRTLLAEWSKELSAVGSGASSWDRSEFWSIIQQHARVSLATQRFVDEWTMLATWESPQRAAEDERARNLVVERERSVKRARARIGNPRALELWQGQSGSRRLDYRWRTVRQLVRDIQEGLENARS